MCSAQYQMDAGVHDKREFTWWSLGSGVCCNIWWILDVMTSASMRFHG